MKQVKSKKTSPTKKSGLTPEQKAINRLQSEHKKFARNTFRFCGFGRVRELADKEFTYEGATSDFDDIFVCENIIVLVEYTIRNEAHVSNHLKSKKILYDKINADPAAFIGFLSDKYSDFKTALSGTYSDTQFRLRIVYASKVAVSQTTKDLVPGVIYLDYSALRYFANVAYTVRRSARFELLEFLSIGAKEFAEGVINPDTSEETSFSCSILPESHSHFPSGFKVISLYLAPGQILSRAYVLRRNGWRPGAGVYQRMVSRTKIDAIRKHLLSGNGVFVNNVIVTLPSSTKLLDNDGDTITVKDIQSTTPGRVKLPSQFNSIGLVDGQHRVFSYYEGGDQEEKMEKLRKQQNLLVTGIMFPKNYTPIKRTQFEAKLFLEINANQTNAKSDLKQEIGVLLKPFLAQSIARRVVNQINDGQGPLSEVFEKYEWDKDRLKTTTIVSYGLVPLVRMSGEESLFTVWDQPNKSNLSNEDDLELLAEYIKFCVTAINTFVAAVRCNIASEKWTADRKISGKVLSTTFVNGLIFCLRRIVKSGEIMNFDQYRQKMANIESFEFHKYKSSQYNAMGEALFNKFF